MTRLEEIKAKYNICTSDFEEIKSTLKGRLKESHPDNNGDYDKDFFIGLIADLEYVESLIGKEENKSMLLPINEEVNALKLQVSDQKQIIEKEFLNARLLASIQSQMSMIKEHHLKTKISSGVILGIMSFFWAFPNQVMEHPMLKILFGNIEQKYTLLLTVLWSYVMAATCLLWLKIVRNERREKEIIKKLKAESIQNEFFMDFIDKISPKTIFSKRDFIEYLSEEAEKGQSVKLQEDVVQSMADIILLRAKDHEVIRRVKSHGLIESYEIVNNE